MVYLPIRPACGCHILMSVCLSHMLRQLDGLLTVDVTVPTSDFHCLHCGPVWMETVRAKWTGKVLLAVLTCNVDYCHIPRL